MPFRIAVGGLGCEACSFSPLFTKLEDFRRFDGENIKKTRLVWLSEFEKQNPDTELCLTMVAGALPGGPIDPPAFEKLVGDLCSSIERAHAQKKLDGVFLRLHGAMYVHGKQDAEGEMLERLRSIVGTDCLISASFDLHGNCSERVIRNLNMLSAYRTAPHLDVTETEQKAMGLLVRCLRENLLPTIVWTPIPIALSGEQTSTCYEPLASLYGSLSGIDGTVCTKLKPQTVTTPCCLEGVLDASLLVGYIWADEPRTGSWVAVTGINREKCVEGVNTIAQKVWSLRKEFHFRVPSMTVPDALKHAKQKVDEDNVYPVFLSDAGDNPTAGGVGDVTETIQCLVQQPECCVGGGVWVMGFADFDCVQHCYQRCVGDVVKVHLGGKLDTLHGPGEVVIEKATIVNFVPKTEETRWGGNQVVLFVRTGTEEEQEETKQNGFFIVVSETRRPYHTRRDLQEVGCDPIEDKSIRIVIVKIGYLEPELAAMSKYNVLLVSSGSVPPAHVKQVEYKHIKRPMYPLDDFDWAPDPK